MEVTMNLSEDGYLLRIFIGKSDKMNHKPLYEWLVTEAKARGMAGATALRGMMGFGAHSKIIHTFKIEHLSEDLPVVIE
jgi:PII-like signaling protein